MDDLSIFSRNSTRYSDRSASKLIPQKRSFSTSQLYPHGNRPLPNHLHFNHLPSSILQNTNLYGIQASVLIDPVNGTSLPQESQPESFQPEKCLRFSELKEWSYLQAISILGRIPTPLQMLEKIAISFIRQLAELDPTREEELENLTAAETQGRVDGRGNRSTPLTSRDKALDGENEEMREFEEDRHVASVAMILLEDESSQSEARVTEAKSQDLRKNQSKRIRRVALDVGIDQPGIKSFTYFFPTVGVPAVLQLARLLKVVLELQAALIAGITVTKRDIYYRDKPLFGVQKTVDRIVDSLSRSLNVRRSALGVGAASKGLITGSVTVERLNGQAFSSEDGVEALIPELEIDEIREVRSDAEWILIVEKEASFKTLMEEDITLKIGGVGKGIILTGKGYPDLSTRQLLKILSIHLENVPIIALVDDDAYGLDILRNYKFGGSSATELAVERIEWAGVKGSEWDDLGIEWGSLLPLTPADRAKALSMLQLDPPIPQKWRRELARSLHLNQKAEIQLLCSIPPPTISSQSDFQSDALSSIASGALLPYVRSKLMTAVQTCEVGRF